MKKNMESTVEFIRQLSCRLYGKEMFFYDEEEDIWYSRFDCKDVEFDYVFEYLKNDILSHLK